MFVSTKQLKLKIMNKATDYKVEELNNGTLFCVSDDYNMYGSYYKTRKGAEKYLAKLLKMVGAC